MTNQKTLGVLTSGGDSPGMNAALRAVVRTGIYHENKIFGIKRGYQGLIEGDVEELQPSSVNNIIKHGGTFLKTARCKGFYTKKGRTKAYNTLEKYGIESLIVIGGDGSLRGLHDLLNEFPIQGIGLPGTIDNDLYGTDYTIGFDTAVNTALEAIDKIRDTATSHSRLFIVEVMGKTSGYIGLHTGISGGAEEILIPETMSDIEKLCKKLDAGHIVLQKPIQIFKSMKLYELRLHTTGICIELVTSAIDMYKEQGDFIDRPQKKLGEYYSFMPSDSKDICLKKFNKYTEGIK